MNRRHFLLLTAAALAACGKKSPKHNALPRGSAVLALGDSLTYGYGANPAESYPARLAELTGWTVTNGGVSGDTCGESKPSVKPMLYACEQIHADPQHTVYVGDAERDMQAGRNAGMKTVLAEWGYIAPEDQTETWPFDHRIASPSDLLKLL